MSPRSMRVWTWLHKWSSLICTVFMLLLCLTGLPLVFHHEIAHLTGQEVEAPALTGEAAQQRVSPDLVMRTAMALHPELMPKYAYMEPDDDTLWHVTLGKNLQNSEGNRSIIVDARTGEVLGQPRYDEGFMHWMTRLHVDLFADLPGMLFLGAMGVLLAVSIVSGVVLYAPFMRKLRFGTVRHQRRRRTYWLDVHNLLGIVTLSWLLVVTLTGIINTISLPLISQWQQSSLAHLRQAPAEAPAIQQSAPLQTMLQEAQHLRPESSLLYFAFPGTIMSTSQHTALYMRGNEAFSKRMLQPMFFEARSARFASAPELPWYLKALLISQPLHFGDYGGLPMQILWALLDLAAIVILGSGLYLWWTKGKSNRSPKADRAHPAAPESLSHVQS